MIGGGLRGRAAAPCLKRDSITRLRADSTFVAETATSAEQVAPRLAAGSFTICYSKAYLRGTTRPGELGKVGHEKTSSQIPPLRKDCRG